MSDGLPVRRPRGALVSVPLGPWRCARRWREFRPVADPPSLVCVGFRILGLRRRSVRPLHSPIQSFLREVHDFLEAEAGRTGLSIPFSNAAGVMASWEDGSGAMSRTWRALEDLSYAMELIPGHGSGPLRLLVRDLMPAPPSDGIAAAIGQEHVGASAEPPMPCDSAEIRRRSRASRLIHYVRLAQSRPSRPVVRAAAVRLGVAAGLGVPEERFAWPPQRARFASSASPPPRPHSRTREMIGELT